MNIVPINIKDIVEDVDQPRRNFDEADMGLLISSIKKYGIKKPLHLEVSPDGTYIIEDGARRYRAAKSIGLKEVPAILTELKNPVQRLIEQFHLQELQQAWTGVEKAMAISNMAELMKESKENIAKLLGQPQSIVKNAISFGNVVDKKNFEKTKVGLRWANSVVGCRRFIEKVAMNNEMDVNPKDIENAIYTRIRNGEELNSGFFTCIKDSIKQKPAIINDFIESDGMTTQQMFVKTKAKGAYALRNVENFAGYLQSHISNFMKDKSVKVEKHTVDAVKGALKSCKLFIDEFDSL